MNPFWSATAIASALRRREVSPTEVLRMYLDRIDIHNGELNAFVWRDDEAAMAAALAAEKLLSSARSTDSLPPFLGVPIPIKNLTSVAGQPNNFGSMGISTAPQPQNDLSVDRLLAGGFVLMGRTNTPEAGMSQGTDNTLYGSTHNPWDLTRTPGGSSGGAAAAVSAGLAPIASASDGGGSIRMPASCTGLVGLKPSRSRVPSASLGWEHGSTDGVITRTVEDTALVLDLLSKDDAYGWYRAPQSAAPFADALRLRPRRLRIGLMTAAPGGVEVDPDCSAAAELVARLLQARGHEIVAVDPDFIKPRLLEIYFKYVIPAALQAMDYEDPAKAEPFIQSRIARAREIDSGTYVQLVREMRAVAREITAHWFDDFDVLVTPTLATRVPPVGVLLDEANTYLTGGGDARSRMLAFVAFVNVLGQPAISVPAAIDREGLPVGVQLIGAPFEEAVLLALAADLERELSWQERVPSPYV